MPSMFTNKELSWLSFNARLLQEASNRDVPLIERIRFLGIFSSNLDEFFRIRVATLKRLTLLGKKAKKYIGHNPNKILKQVQDIVLEQHRLFDKIYQDILTELAAEKIFIVNESQLNEEQGRYVKSYFQHEVRHRLFPIILDDIRKLPDLKDHAIYLSVTMSRQTAPAETKYALIEVPSPALSRFLILPQHNENRYIILLDDVIRYGLEDVFSIFQFDSFMAYTVKLTRDAEMDMTADYSQSLVKKLTSGLRQRKKGQPIRFVYDASLPQPLLNIFVKRLRLNSQDTLIPGARYHNFKDFMNFPDFGLKHLRYKAIRPLPHRDLKPRQSIMKAMSGKDILLHYPYQSFDYLIDLLREASIDPNVNSVKFTIYRAARNSSIINALINAAKNGKNVAVLVELQARFDEEANIQWANQLQEEGVTVIHGVPGLKVHSKLCLITSRIKGKPEYHAVIGTGNFNEDTARIYGDHTLLTTDRRLTQEVKKIFEFFETNYKTSSFKHLLVSPFNMRSEFISMIRRETELARAGREAYIHLKLNNLVDNEIIQSLYEASQAGVRIKLNIRGMFALQTGLPGIGDNIEAIGIIDKFLEHSRIYVFGNNGDPRYFISSADLMRRNLDHRVEVTCPVYDKALQKELQDYLDIQQNDNVKARILDRRLENKFREGAPDSKLRAQFLIYDYLQRLHSPAPLPESKVEQKI